MSKLNFAMFMAGATVGATATWLYLKKHYEQIAQEEIDSVKAVFAERKNVEYTPKPDTDEQQDKQHKADIAKLKPDLVDYAAKLQKEGYANYTEHSAKNNDEEKGNSMPDEPYVISPEEFGESDNYEQINLTYYSDGVLADDSDEIMDDIEGTVGEDFADHFGDYEDDSVHIRNDRLRCDYEILKDNRTYDEVVGERP